MAVAVLKWKPPFLPHHVAHLHTAPAGLCALCPNSNNSLMVYPSRGVGRVELVDLGTQDSEAKEIVAHETAITCISLNLQGTRVATASEKVQ